MADVRVVVVDVVRMGCISPPHYNEMMVMMMMMLAVLMRHTVTDEK
jgi:hypothetical protein